MPLQPGQTAQRHFHDGVGLHIVQREIFTQRLFCFRHRLRRPNDFDNLINEIQRNFIAFKQMRPFFGLAQIILGPAGHDLFLIGDIMLQHLLQIQNLWFAVYQRQHNHAKGGLQLGKGIQLVEHHLRIHILFQLHHDFHTLAVGIVHNIVDALNPLGIHQIHHGFNQVLLINHIWNLGDHNLIFIGFDLFNFRPAPHNNPPAPGGIGRPDARPPHNDAACGKIRPRQNFIHLRNIQIGVIDQRRHAVDDLRQIVRRNIGRHTYRNTGRAVDQQLRKPRR